MSQKGTTSYRIGDQNALHFITLTAVGWLDIFTRKIYKDLIVNSLDFAVKNKGLEIYAYCIMSNHIHLIVRASEGFNLSDILRDFKKFTSRQIINLIKEENESRREWMLNLFQYAGQKNPNNKNFQVWRHDNHPVELYSSDVIDQKLDYIHKNPVVAGIVENEEDYIYSSARNFAGLTSVLQIEEL